MTFALLLPLLAQAAVATDPKLDALVPRAPDRLQTCLHQAQDDPEAAIKTDDKADIEAKMEALGKASQKLGEIMYAQAQAEGQPAADGAQAAGGRGRLGRAQGGLAQGSGPGRSDRGPSGRGPGPGPDRARRA